MEKKLPLRRKCEPDLQKAVPGSSKIRGQLIFPERIADRNFTLQMNTAYTLFFPGKLYKIYPASGRKHIFHVKRDGPGSNRSSVKWGPPDLRTRKSSKASRESRPQARKRGLLTDEEFRAILNDVREHGKNNGEERAL